METGFYKNDNETLLHAPNFVYNKDYTLLVEQKNTYSYPVDGWKYFETREAALTEYGLTDPVVEEVPGAIKP